MKRILLTILALLMLSGILSGCGEEETPMPIGSKVWETMPQLTFGVMENEKLQVLPWNCGRCEATGFNTIAETEEGYYMTTGAPYILRYADKTNLAAWIPVCSKPQCGHNDIQCEAYMSREGFVIRDDRIYYQQSLYGEQSELYSGGAAEILVSMAPNGTDKRFEFAFDEYVPTTLASSSSLLDSQHWLVNIVELNEDGTQTAYAYRVTAQGQEKYPKVENYQHSCTLQTTEFSLHLYGDKVYMHGVLSDSRKVFFRFDGDTPEPVDTTDLPAQFAYLSGDILRFFKINDGYYDMNIKTGEQVKLADAQLENSFANIMLPNCIIESTLMTYRMTGNTDHYTEGMTHRMRLFDGESWRDVELPAELLGANGKTFMIMECVASDCVILTCRDMASNTGDTHYYRIDLTKDKLKLEYIATM